MHITLPIRYWIFFCWFQSYNDYNGIGKCVHLVAGLNRSFMCNFITCLISCKSSKDFKTVSTKARHGPRV